MDELMNGFIVAPGLICPALSMLFHELDLISSLCRTCPGIDRAWKLGDPPRGYNRL